MGRKVNPVGLRLGSQRKWNSGWIESSLNYRNFLHESLNIEKYIESFITYNLNRNYVIVYSSIYKSLNNELYYFALFYRLNTKNTEIEENSLPNKSNLNLTNKSTVKNLNLLWNSTFLFKTSVINKTSISTQNLNTIINYYGNLHNLFSLKNKQKSSKILLDYFQINKEKTFKQIELLKKSHVNKNVNPWEPFILETLILNEWDNLVKAIRISKIQDEQNIKIFDKINFSFQLYKLTNFLVNQKNNDKINQLIFLFLLMKYSKLDSNRLISKTNSFFPLFNIMNNFLKAKNLKEILNLSKVNKLNKDLLVHFQTATVLNDFRESSYSLGYKNKLNSLYLNNLFLYRHNLINQSNRSIKPLLKNNYNKFHVNFIFMNSLSFLKYKESNEPTKQINIKDLERTLIRFHRKRFKVETIKQMVYGGLTAMYFKNTRLLVRIIVDSIESLPKSTKHGFYFKFLKKNLEALLSVHKEIIGIRIKFKGRFNKWKRTKSVYIEKGTLPLREFQSRIEYSSGHGCMRRGLFGVKIWIAYKPINSHEMEQSLNNYLNSTYFLKN